jgi:hypothetical protein
MQRTCEDCGCHYDDGVMLTRCPHQRFLTNEQAAQKDLAISLLGKRLNWRGIPGPEPFTINAISQTGMVEVSGFTGLFAPNLFVVVDEKEQP